MQVSSIPLGRREGRAESGQERGSPLSRVSITQCRSLHVARANPGHVIPLSQLSYCGCPRGVRRGRVHDLRIIAAGAMPKAHAAPWRGVIAELHLSCSVTRHRDVRWSNTVALIPYDIQRSPFAYHALRFAATGPEFVVISVG